MRSVIRRSLSPFRGRKSARQLIEEINEKERQFRDENRAAREEDFEVQIKPSTRERTQESPPKVKRDRSFRGLLSTGGRRKEPKTQILLYPPDEFDLRMSVSQKCSTPSRQWGYETLEDEIQAGRISVATSPERSRSTPLRARGSPTGVCESPPKWRGSPQRMRPSPVEPRPLQQQPISQEDDISVGGHVSLDAESVQDIQEALREMEEQLKRAMSQGQRVSRAKVMDALLSVVDSLDTETTEQATTSIDNSVASSAGSSEFGSRSGHSVTAFPTPSTFASTGGFEEVKETERPQEFLDDILRRGSLLSEEDEEEDPISSYGDSSTFSHSSDAYTNGESTIESHDRWKKKLDVRPKSPNHEITKSVAVDFTNQRWDFSSSEGPQSPPNVTRKPSLSPPGSGSKTFTSFSDAQPISSKSHQEVTQKHVSFNSESNCQKSIEQRPAWTVPTGSDEGVAAPNHAVQHLDTEHSFISQRSHCQSLDLSWFTLSDDDVQRALDDLLWRAPSPTRRKVANESVAPNMASKSSDGCDTDPTSATTRSGIERSPTNLQGPDPLDREAGLAHKIRGKNVAKNYHRLKSPPPPPPPRPTKLVLRDLEQNNSVISTESSRLKSPGSKDNRHRIHIYSRRPIDLKRKLI